MTKRWRPGAIVPVLIVRVETAPLPFSGVTAAGLKLVVPIPVGSGPSSDRLTFAPYAAPERVRASWNVTVSPTFAAVLIEASAVIVKSRLTVPILIAMGSYFVVRYGAPAWPWTQIV